MVLFRKEYLPISSPCFLSLIFLTWSTYRLELSKPCSPQNTSNSALMQYLNIYIYIYIHRHIWSCLSSTTTSTVIRSNIPNSLVRPTPAIVSDDLVQSTKSRAKAQQSRCNHDPCIYRTIFSLLRRKANFRFIVAGNLVKGVGCDYLQACFTIGPIRLRSHTAFFSFIHNPLTPKDL
jgi:hypothetical protein